MVNRRPGCGLRGLQTLATAEIWRTGGDPRPCFGAVPRSAGGQTGSGEGKVCALPTKTSLLQRMGGAYISPPRVH